MGEHECKSLLLFLVSCLLCASGHALPAAEKTPHFLIHVLTTVKSDYPEAVRAGKIISRPEYNEILEALSQAMEATESLSPDLLLPLRDGLGKLQKLVLSRPSRKEVDKGVDELERLLIPSVTIQQEPPHSPNLEEGRNLYTSSCVACHGSHGNGRGRVAHLFDPRPTNLRDPREMATFSEFQLFGVIRFGLVGTAMPAFETLSDEEVWNLSHYVLSLSRAEGRALAGSKK